MIPNYEYRVIKEEINASLAFANDIGDANLDYSMIAAAQHFEPIVNYKVQVKGSFFLWHDVRSFKSLRRAIEFKRMMEGFDDAPPEQATGGQDGEV